MKHRLLRLADLPHAARDWAARAAVKALREAPACDLLDCGDCARLAVEAVRAALDTTPMQEFAEAMRSVGGSP